MPLYNAGAFAPSTITRVLVPVKSIMSKRVLTAPSLSLDINVIAALSDGLLANRSEERRVGKEGRSRGSPYHEKKK